MSIYSKMLMDMMAMASIVLSDDTILNPKEVEEEKDIEMRMNSNGVYTEEGEESVDNIKKIGIVGIGGTSGITLKQLKIQPSWQYNKFKIFDPRIKELLELADKQELIDDIKDNMYAFEERDIFIKSAGFALITKNFVKALSEWIGGRSVLEIMAGTGYISKSLKDEGVNVVAVTDIKESSWGFKKEWTEVEKLSANDAIMKYNNVDIIICSWAYMDNNMYEALLTMREYNPNAIILYIGEDYGGCTANDNFFENLISIEDDVFEENVIPLYRQWYGIHDEPRLVR